MKDSAGRDVSSMRRDPQFIEDARRARAIIGDITDEMIQKRVDEALATPRAELDCEKKS